MKAQDRKSKFIQQLMKDEAAIFCDGCTKMIEEDLYISHWNQCITKKKRKPVAAIQAKSQVSQEIKKEIPPNTEKAISVRAADMMCNKCQQRYSFNAKGEEIHQCPQKQQICRCGQNFPRSLIRQHQEQCQIRLAIIQSEKISQRTERSPNQVRSKRRDNPNEAAVGPPAIIEDRSQNQLFKYSNQVYGEENEPHNVEQYYTQDCFGQETNEHQDLVNQLFQMFKKREFLTDEEMKTLTKKLYNPKQMKDSECTICQSPFKQGDEVIILDCQHIFHQSDIQRWLKSNVTCPNCKKILKKNK